MEEKISTGFTDLLMTMLKNKEKWQATMQPFKIGIEAAASVQGDTLCTHNARIICSNAVDPEDTIKIDIKEGNVYMGDFYLLKRTDIKPETSFSGCKKNDQGICEIAKNYLEWIEDGEWKDVDQTSGQGKKEEALSRERSFMICTEYEGVIYFYTDGQRVSGRIYEEIEKFIIARISNILLPYYYNHQYLIADITLMNSDGKFDRDIEIVKEIYEQNKNTYLEISEKTGVPSELIVAIHYRESGCDFNTYLHNGQKLGQPTTIVPKNRIFYDFSEAAIDALNSIQNGKGIELEKDDDMAIMMTFAEAYNGTGYTDYRNIPSPYIYSGTDQYSSGKYVADGNYDPNVTDRQPGVYLLVSALKEE